jgi:hypothetical protein
VAGTADAPAGHDGLTEARVEALVAAAARDLDPDDPTWLLADRLARLLGADPDRIDLAIEWLDALLRHDRR